MEQPPEQEGTIPAPSSREGSQQLPQEPVGGEEIPEGKRESPAPAVGQPGCAPHLPPDQPPKEDAQEKQPTEDTGGSLAAPPIPSPSAGGSPEEPPRTRSPAREAEPEFYCVKWISWKGERSPVVMQSQNGPCPLLAIINILLLQWNINDSMTVLPKLATGLDVNVRFTGVSDFEYTPECIVFDLLNVPLYHGWLVDPQSPEVVQAVGKLSYNQLVEKIITCKQASDSSLVSEGLVAEQFLEATASQLTFHG
ncbi:PREDICTED: protein FAM63A, partial [Chaetura pelagica]|uniref:protein FAM63A n=1 Tax=Chaetura pelagica TaxID=8897 RepID=UPI000523E542